VSVALPPEINAWREMRLVEVKGGERVPVPSQIEAGEPRRLCWILDGGTPEGAKRTYELLRGARFGGDRVEMVMTARTLETRFRGATLFRYNHAHVVPPEGVRPAYIRSGYIHPMYNPAGALITEDFPGDHHHHKGIWMPWTRTEFEGHAVDFWNLGARQGTVQFAGFVGIENGPVFGRFRAKHEHVDLQQPNGGKVVLDETWDVRVWAVGGPKRGFWLWDLTSTQTNVAGSPLHLKKYRYGGLGYRGPKEWTGNNYKVLASTGKTKKDGHYTEAKWCAHSGAIDGESSTVVLMCHPSNERFPEGMRIWPSGGAFFNFCPVQSGDWDFEPGETHVFRYRFFIHGGTIDPMAAERTWKDFGEPPRVTLKRTD
jgi:hypothetical protein